MCQGWASVPFSARWQKNSTLPRNTCCSECPVLSAACGIKEKRTSCRGVNPGSRSQRSTHKFLPLLSAYCKNNPDIVDEVIRNARGERPNSDRGDENLIVSHSVGSHGLHTSRTGLIIFTSWRVVSIRGYHPHSRGPFFCHRSDVGDAGHRQLHIGRMMLRCSKVSTARHCACS